VYTSSNSTIHTNKRGVDAKSEADVLALFANSTPSTSYGRSKKAATQWVLANDKVGRMRTTVLMPGVVLGPREPRLLAPILDDTHVHLFKPELSGSLNFCHSRSLAQAHILAAERLLAGDKSVPGHIFMISDGIENVIQVEVLFREALGKGPGKILGAISYILVAVAYLANWITNDRWNNPLVQVTSTTIGLIFNGPIMSSTFEAEKALGWKPSSMDAIIKALVDYYKPSIKK
jgi:nucleoside-diphosphate-sugar epimerase